MAAKLFEVVSAAFHAAPAVEVALCLNGCFCIRRQLCEKVVACDSLYRIHADSVRLHAPGHTSVRQYEPDSGFC